MNNEETTSSAKRESLVEEIEKYGNQQNLICANRDGDLYFIECPKCHSTDLNTQRLIGCRYCHTRFSLYFEDGMRIFHLDNEMGTASPSNGRIKIIELKKDDYFSKILLPRNEKRLNELKEKYPDFKVIILNKDLRKDGKDAHGHHKYESFALVPID